MKNFVQRGDIVTVAAPYDRLSGEGALVGSLFGVCVADALNGADVEIKTTGVFDITALTADTAAVGAKLYWDNTNKRLTTTAAGNSYVGVATKAKTGTDTTARIRLNGFI